MGREVFKETGKGLWKKIFEITNWAIETIPSFLCFFKFLAY